MSALDHGGGEPGPRFGAAMRASAAYAGGGGSPKASGTAGSRARDISAIRGGRSRPRWQAGTHHGREHLLGVGAGAVLGVRYSAPGRRPGSSRGRSLRRFHRSRSRVVRGKSRLVRPKSSFSLAFSRSSSRCARPADPALVAVPSNRRRSPRPCPAYRHMRPEATHHFAVFSPLPGKPRRMYYARIWVRALLAQTTRCRRAGPEVVVPFRLREHLWGSRRGDCLG